MKRWGMVVDLKRCIGCQTCTLACKVKNGTPPGIFFRRVMEKMTGSYPKVKRTYLPMQCMHCEDPPCVKNCPSGVFYKRPDGPVLIDSSKCYGARVCRMVCPYNAISFIEEIKHYYPDGMTETEKHWYQHHEVGTVGKCDFCIDRVDQGLPPACVQACPTDALTFGDLNDEADDVCVLMRERQTAFQIHSELGTNPSIYYLR